MAQLCGLDAAETGEGAYNKANGGSSQNRPGAIGLWTGNRLARHVVDIDSYLLLSNTAWRYEWCDGFLALVDELQAEARSQSID